MSIRTIDSEFSQLQADISKHSKTKPKASPSPSYTPNSIQSLPDTKPKKDNTEKKAQMSQLKKSKNTAAANFLREQEKSKIKQEISPQSPVPPTSNAVVYDPLQFLNEMGVYLPPITETSSALIKIPPRPYEKKPPPSKLSKNENQIQPLFPFEKIERCTSVNEGFKRSPISVDCESTACFSKSKHTSHDFRNKSVKEEVVEDGCGVNSAGLGAYEQKHSRNRTCEPVKHRKRDSSSRNRNSREGSSRNGFDRKSCYSSSRSNNSNREDRKGSDSKKSADSRQSNRSDCERDESRSKDSNFSSVPSNSDRCEREKLESRSKDLNFSCWTSNSDSAKDSCVDRRDLSLDKEEVSAGFQTSFADRVREVNAGLIAKALDDECTFAARVKSGKRLSKTSCVDGEFTELRAKNEGVNKIGFRDLEASSSVPNKNTFQSKIFTNPVQPSHLLDKDKINLAFQSKTFEKPVQPSHLLDKHKINLTSQALLQSSIPRNPFLNSNSCSVNVQPKHSVQFESSNRESLTNTVLKSNKESSNRFSFGSKLVFQGNSKNCEKFDQYDWEALPSKRTLESEFEAQAVKKSKVGEGVEKVLQCFESENKRKEKRNRGGRHSGGKNRLRDERESFKGMKDGRECGVRREERWEDRDQRLRASRGSEKGLLSMPEKNEGWGRERMDKQ